MLYRLATFMLIALIPTSCSKAPLDPARGAINIQLIWPEGSRNSPPKLTAITANPAQIRVTLNPGERVFTFDFGAHTGSIEELDPGTYSLLVQTIDENMNVTHEGSANGLIVEAGKATSVTVSMRALANFKTQINSFDPDNLVEIVVSPGDSAGVKSGLTPFVLTYPQNVEVRLTAKLEASGKPFQKWKTNDGSYVSDPTIALRMDQNQTITAVYGTPLIAQFEVNKTCGISPFEVKFTDKSQGRITEWQWDFGDGNKSAEQNPTHTYNTTGAYSVSLTVSNLAGPVSTQSSNLVTVDPPAPSAPLIRNTDRRPWDTLLDNGCKNNQNPLVWNFDWNPAGPATMYHLRGTILKGYDHRDLPIVEVLFDVILDQPSYHYESAYCILSGTVRITISTGRSNGCGGPIWGAASTQEFAYEACGSDCP